MPGVLAGVGSIVHGVVLIAFADRITAVTRRKAERLSSPRSLSTSDAEGSVGWLATLMGILAALVVRVLAESSQRSSSGEHSLTVVEARAV